MKARFDIKGNNNVKCMEIRGFSFAMTDRFFLFVWRFRFDRHWWCLFWMLYFRIFVLSMVSGQTKPIPEHLLQTILPVVASNFRPITETCSCFMMLMLIFTAWKLRKWIDPQNRRWILHSYIFFNKTAVCMKTRIASHTRNIIQKRIITTIFRELF